MPIEPARRQFAAALIERHDHHMLIQRCAGDPGLSPVWQFPRGAVKPGESSEGAMRRIAREILGVDVEVVVGQPPFVEVVDGVRYELRYFFCGIIRGEIMGDDQDTLRWISKAHLREYDFDALSRPVAEWLLDT